MMALRLAELGYPVLRFDFYGLGDAEGELEEEYLADLYGTVSAGRYVADARSALDWMQKECAISQFVVGGLCGGAMTGLLAGGDDDRIVGLLSLGIPVIRYSASIDPGRYMTRGQVRDLRRGYIRKLMSPAAWARLVTLRSDYRSIGRIVKSALAGLSRAPAASQNAEQAAQSGSGEESTNLNPLFGPAFFKMLGSNRRILLIFSGSDRLTWEYEEKFAMPNKVRIAQFEEDLEVHTVPDANHVFSGSEWQQEMMTLAEDWLERYFPVNSPSARASGS
jgi:alpha/beta superfamily hydrolase